jgi:hypothetical protein
MDLIILTTSLHAIKDSCIRARFWRDEWLGHFPRTIVYSKIFAICDEQGELVHRILRNNEANLTFRRYFGDNKQVEWQQLTPATVR